MMGDVAGLEDPPQPVVRLLVLPGGEQRSAADRFDHGQHVAEAAGKGEALGRGHQGLGLVEVAAQPEDLGLRRPGTAEPDGLAGFVGEAAALLGGGDRRLPLAQLQGAVGAHALRLCQQRHMPHG